jgi:hypothetical protein
MEMKCGTTGGLVLWKCLFEPGWSGIQLVIGGRLVVDVKMKGEIMDVCDSGVLLYVSICTEICVLAYNKILNMKVFSKTMSKISYDGYPDVLT